MKVLEGKCGFQIHWRFIPWESGWPMSGLLDYSVSNLLKCVFKASALWADAFYKSKCPSVCLSVCPSVHMFTFEVPFKRLFFPKDSESLKILDIRLREVGAKRQLNDTSKVNTHTDTQTDRQTDISTYRKHRPRGPML